MITKIGTDVRWAFSAPLCAFPPGIRLLFESLPSTVSVRAFSVVGQKVGQAWMRSAAQGRLPHRLTANSALPDGEKETAS